jgi:HK97 family phage major capsid protein
MIQHDKDTKNYSFLKVLRALADSTERTTLGVERELHQECEKRYGVPGHGGIYVPFDLPVEKRAGLSTLTNAAGAYAVETEIQPLIDLLRNAMVVRKAGATILDNLSDTIAFPKQLTAGTANWQGEAGGVDNTDADITFGQISMSPKMLVSSTSYSRKLLAQTSGAVDQWVRNDLTSIMALAIDLAALNGSGAANQPLGLLNQVGINLITYGANGAAPVFADFLSMETLVNVANVPVGGPRAYVLTPEVRAFGKKTVKVTGQLTGTIVADDNTIVGNPSFITSQLPKNLVRGTASDCHAGIFGDWSSLMVGFWGALELITDIYTQKKAGMVSIAAYAMCDVNVRTPVSFTASKYWSGALTV